jgi:hypothetical protein
LLSLCRKLCRRLRILGRDSLPYSAEQRKRALLSRKHCLARRCFSFRCAGLYILVPLECPVGLDGDVGQHITTVDAVRTDSATGGCFFPVIPASGPRARLCGGGDSSQRQLRNSREKRTSRRQRCLRDVCLSGQRSGDGGEQDQQGFPQRWKPIDSPRSQRQANLIGLSNQSRVALLCFLCNEQGICT